MLSMIYELIWQIEVNNVQISWIDFSLEWMKKPISSVFQLQQLFINVT